jgi:hypothetical protein
LKGFIFDHTGEQNPEQYLKTTKEIVNFVGRTYDRHKPKFIKAVEELKLDDPEAPSTPSVTDAIALELWKLDIRQYRATLEDYVNFRGGLYNTVLGQCTDALEERLRSHSDFPAAEQDGIKLLRIIKSVLYAFEEKRQ